MQLYFIRHAESDNNYLYASTGSWKGRSEDPGVTSRGEKQAELLAQFIQSSNLGITHLYSSLMVRAAFTATRTAQYCGLSLSGWTDLHENGGIYNYDPSAFQTGLSEADLPKIGLPGKTRSQLGTLFPLLHIPEETSENGWWNKPYEDRPDRPIRAKRIINRLLGLHGSSNDRVALVSHGGFYNTFLRTLFQMPTTLSMWFHLNNCGISLIDFGEGSTGDQDSPPGETRVVYLNRTDFLPSDLLT